MLVGTIVGSYRIVEPLGVGGMGEVYVGEHVRIVRRVAVKFLLPELTGNREIVERFFAEARSTSSIRHPGIVEIFDCDVDPSGRAYIVMELLAGESLASRLERDPDFGRDVDRPLAVAEQMASALSAAHGNGIIHRDLKPDNVFLIGGADDAAGSALEVKILDFGIAKLLVRNEVARTGRISITIPGSVLGTPKYMSPEQCCDASNVDHRTDLYSLGCILFEMLAGRPPFVAASFAELVAAQLSQVPPELGELREGVPRRVQSLVRRLLAKSPADRPSNMEEVRQEIAEVRAGLVEAQVKDGPRPTDKELFAMGDRRSRRVVAVAALSLAAVCLVGGGAVAIALGHRSKARSVAEPVSPAVIDKTPQDSGKQGLKTAHQDGLMSRAPVATPIPVVVDPPTANADADTGDVPALEPTAAAAHRKTVSNPPPRRLQRPSSAPSLSDEARKL